MYVIFTRLSYCNTKLTYLEGLVVLKEHMAHVCHSEEATFARDVHARVLGHNAPNHHPVGMASRISSHSLSKQVQLLDLQKLTSSHVNVTNLCSLRLL